MEDNNQMKSIAKQQKIMANHQVMMQAPNKVREKFIQEVYTLNILEVLNHHLEEKVRQAELCMMMQHSLILSLF
jgi:hypothetical protein